MHGNPPSPVITPVEKKQRGRFRRLVTWLVVLLILGGFGYYFYSYKPGQTTRISRRSLNAGQVTPVVAVPATRADVPVYLDAVGTAQALNTVTVRSQVDGKLISVNFDEGQDVKKNDILAEIDPITFKAALDQAVAKKAQDEALLANAKIDLDRYERLAASNAINRQQADTQRALVAQYTAQVQADQAAIENAKATLDYTTIRAPIDGRTGIRQVDVGNIIHASDTTGLVVITQIKPISVLFNLPQQDLDRVNTAFAKGPLEVDALRSDNNKVIGQGRLTVIDNRVDSSTGTVRLKSEFPNPDLQLWPGQFLNVRLLVGTLKQAVVVPTGAVQRGPNGTYVFIVKDDNTVAMQSVTVGMQDETRAVITKGVEPPQRVVTTGFARLTDGSKVVPSAPGETAAPAAGSGRAGEAPGQRKSQGSGQGSNQSKRQNGG
ncbi:MAG: Multidrug efflux system MdtABC-TolC, membrane fusion component MdtA [Pseudolabrys sp.]|jgi:multidrug efflux system membrane fusion protein|nr:Multidrug efflux system MdtABC-TolC, membrane fusion component MdtA [Pseudolabrys sp.]